jgi:hypothetical protein
VRGGRPRDGDHQPRVVLQLRVPGENPATQSLSSQAWDKRTCVGA